MILAVQKIDPNFYAARWRMGASLEQKGEYQKAIETADPGDPNMAGLSAALASGWPRGYWQRELENIPPNLRTGLGAAYCYMHLGRREEALQALETSYGKRDNLDFILWLPIREEFDPLQSDPRFQKMLKGLGIPLDSGFPQRGV